VHRKIANASLLRSAAVWRIGSFTFEIERCYDWWCRPSLVKTCRSSTTRIRILRIIRLLRLGWRCIVESYALTLTDEALHCRKLCLPWMWGSLRRLHVCIHNSRFGESSVDWSWCKFLMQFYFVFLESVKFWNIVIYIVIPILRLEFQDFSLRCPVSFSPSVFGSCQCTSRW